MGSVEVVRYLCLAAVAAAILVYSGYRYYNSSKNKRADKSRKIATLVSEENLISLRNECWEKYVELETLCAYKSKCAKVINGEIGLLIAFKQLQSILTASKSVDYKATRVIVQVCDYIINLVTVNKMLNSENNVIMPQVKPIIMSKEAFFQNIQVSTNQQKEKYKSVINYQTNEIITEKADLKFCNMLHDLLPFLQAFMDMQQKEYALSNIEIMAQAESHFETITKIFSRYGYVI